MHEYDPTDVLRLLKQVSPDIICIAGDTFERHGSGRNPFYSVKSTVMKLDNMASVVNGKKRESGSQYLYRFLREVSKFDTFRGDIER